jgi:hypothetical protein
LKTLNKKLSIPSSVIKNTFFLTLFSISSCIQFRGDDNYAPKPSIHRGKLSEAMEKSSDIFTQERKVADTKITFDHENPDFRNRDYKNTVPAPLQTELNSNCNAYPVYPILKPKAPDSISINNSTKKLKSITSLNYSYDTTILLKSITDSTGRIDNNNLLINQGLYYTVLKSNNFQSFDTSLISDCHIPPNELAQQLQTDSLTYTSEDLHKFEGTSDHSLFLGIKLHGALKYNKHYTQSIGGSILFGGFSDEHNRLAIYASGGSLLINKHSEYYNSINSIFNIHIGLQYRHYLNQPYNFIGIFFPIDLSLQYIAWGYKNSIVTDVHGPSNNLITQQSIKNDGLWGIALNSGMGMTIFNSSRFQIALESTFGGTLYWLETVEKFENDVFIGDLFIQLAVEFSFKW